MRFELFSRVFVDPKVNCLHWRYRFPVRFRSMKIFSRDYVENVFVDCQYCSTGCEHRKKALSMGTIDLTRDRRHHQDEKPADDFHSDFDLE